MASCGAPPSPWRPDLGDTPPTHEAADFCSIAPPGHRLYARGEDMPPFGAHTQPTHEAVDQRTLFLNRFVRQRFVPHLVSPSGGQRACGGKYCEDTPPIEFAKSGACRRRARWSTITPSPHLGNRAWGAQPPPRSPIQVRTEALGLFCSTTSTARGTLHARNKDFNSWQTQLFGKEKTTSERPSRNGKQLN